MGDLSNYDDPRHRMASASAAFQRGIYHLYLLLHRGQSDVYTTVLRTYQCLYVLLLTLLLLDFDGFRLNHIEIPPRLRKFAANGGRPARSEIDPAAIITHSTFEAHRWKGFGIDHPLHQIALEASRLYDNTVKPRHNLLYRPFLLDRGHYHWEDCTLIDLLMGLPSPTVVERAYEGIVKAICDWHTAVGNAIEPYPAHFLELLFMPYDPVDNDRNAWPKETLLLRYARLLSTSDDELLIGLRTYRNELLDIPKLMSLPSTILPAVSSHWKVGEI